MNIKIKKFFLPAAVSLLMLVSCDRDKDGMFLCSNYCTATIDGIEYLWRESYTVPLKGGWPYARYGEMEKLAGKEVNLSFLEISTRLQPADKGSDDVYYITLYVKDFSVNESPVGKSYVFSPVGVSPGRVLEAMCEGDVSIAMVRHARGGVETEATASGSVLFTKHAQEEGSVRRSEASYIDVDFSLSVAEGERPVSIEGSLHTWL